MYAVQSARPRMTFEVIRGDRSGNGQPGSIEVDMADASSVDRAFRQTEPDFVLLLAAMSDIDRCETIPEQAFAVNARGAENVANACARAERATCSSLPPRRFSMAASTATGKRMRSHPLSVYGKTKAWAENAVQTLTPSAIVIRFALVLGFARKSGTNAMFDSVMRKWKAGEPVFLSTREVRNPIDAASLNRGDDRHARRRSESAVCIT